MFPHGPRTVSSRVGKKQVSVFLSPEQIDAAYAKAARENKTNQEVLGEAINAAMSSKGYDPPIVGGHVRVIRRNRGNAIVRGRKEAPCRVGCISFTGWFDASAVESLMNFSTETGISVQKAIEEGIEMVTGNTVWAGNKGHFSAEGTQDQDFADAGVEEDVR